jgi:hypothetical protein
MLDRYVAGELELDADWREDFGQYSKDGLRTVLEAERIFRSTTLDDWLEIARDFYQDATDTKRRPQLLEPEFVTFLGLNEKYGADEDWFRPEQFLNAVWVLGKDTNVDHATFEILPYYLEKGPCWKNYEGRSYDYFKIYRQREDDAFRKTVQLLREEIDAEARRQVPRTVANPHCRARCHMKRSPFAIYDFAVGVSHNKGGECWLSLKTCSEWAHMHTQTVRPAVDWLVKNGWLVELRAPRHGVGGAGLYRVVGHGEWIANHGSTTCVQVETSG